MPNVKPGDLCIVLGADLTTSLNGRIVTVLHSYNGEKIINVDGELMSQDYKNAGVKSWVCSSNSDLPLQLYNLATQQKTRVIQTPVRAIQDLLLYKINDQDLDEEIEVEDNPEVEKEIT